MRSKEVCIGKEQGKKTQAARGLEEDGRNMKTTASVVMDNISQVGGESASMTMIAARDFFWGVERFLDTRRKFQASVLYAHTDLEPFSYLPLAVSLPSCNSLDSRNHATQNVQLHPTTQHASSNELGRVRDFRHLFLWLHTTTSTVCFLVCTRHRS